MQISTLASHFEAVHADKGRRPDCGVRSWLAEQVAARRPVAEVRAEMVARPDWEPRFSVDALLEAARYPEADRLEAQLVYARDLLARPERSLLERLIAGHGEKIAPEAFAVLIEALSAVHPNPKGFLVQDAVLAKVPASIDLTGLRAAEREVADEDGDIVPLKSLVVAGGRGAKPRTQAQENARLRAKLAVLKAQRPRPVRAAEALAPLKAEAAAKAAAKKK